MRTRRNRSRPRGFALFVVVILLGLMTAAAAVTLDDAVESIQNSSGIRASELVRAGLDSGLDQAMLEIVQRDATEFVDVNPDWDIFAGPVPDGTGIPFVPSFTYPTAGDYQNDYRVRIGVRPGQVTKAPAGEDVRNSYGHVLEIQLGVESIHPTAPPVEERVTVGVVVPRRRTGS